MRFLEQRDHEFDFVKSFLVISMTIAHGFQFFYNQHYNRNLTYYVLIGFVFMSGLTVGGVYQGKFLTRPIVCGWAILSRALKLLGIFLILNTVIIMLSADDLWHTFKLRYANLLFSAMFDGSGEELYRISFRVLVPISLTFVGSVALLSWRRRYLDLLFLFLFIFGLWTIEITGYLNYYGLKMLIVGLIGVLLSKALFSVDWEQLRSNLSKWHFALWICYIAYQIALLVFNKEWDLVVRHYLNVTILLLSATYMTSYRIRLISYRSVGVINRALGNHLLFAYLFHLCLLRILVQFIEFRSLDFAGSMVASLFVLAVTILSGLLISVLTNKYKKINKLYSMVFR